MNCFDLNFHFRPIWNDPVLVLTDSLHPRGRGQDGQVDGGHDRGEDEGERPLRSQEAQLLGRRHPRCQCSQEVQQC